MKSEVERLQDQVIRIKMQRWGMNKAACKLEIALHTLQFWEKKLAYTIERR